MMLQKTEKNPFASTVTTAASAAVSNDGCFATRCTFRKGAAASSAAAAQTDGKRRGLKWTAPKTGESLLPRVLPVFGHPLPISIELPANSCAPRRISPFKTGRTMGTCRHKSVKKTAHRGERFPIRRPCGTGCGKSLLENERWGCYQKLGGFDERQRQTENPGAHLGPDGPDRARPGPVLHGFRVGPLHLPEGRRRHDAAALRPGDERHLGPADHPVPVRHLRLPRAVHHQPAQAGRIRPAGKRGALPADR